jgi:hypothetical protein
MNCERHTFLSQYKYCSYFTVCFRSNQNISIIIIFFRQLSYLSGGETFGGRSFGGAKPWYHIAKPWTTSEELNFFLPSNVFQPKYIFRIYTHSHFMNILREVFFSIRGQQLILNINRRWFNNLDIFFRQQAMVATSQLHSVTSGQKCLCPRFSILSIMVHVFFAIWSADTFFQSLPSYEHLILFIFPCLPQYYFFEGSTRFFQEGIGLCPSANEIYFIFRFP